MKPNKLDVYKQWETELFSVKDTIGVPHPYCITSAHVKYSDMFLDPESAESKGARCGVRGCQLSYAEHETALAIKCKTTTEPDLLHEYLLAIKEQTEKDKYTGFVFVDCSKGERNAVY